MLVLRKCIHEEINLYQSFYWSFLILCKYNTDIMSMCMKKCHAPIKQFWQSDYLSNLAIFMAFVFSIVVFFIDHYCTGVSNNHCLLSFFSLILYCRCVGEMGGVNELKLFVSLKGILWKTTFCHHFVSDDSSLITQLSLTDIQGHSGLLYVNFGHSVY